MLALIDASRPSSCASFAGTAASRAAVSQQIRRHRAIEPSNGLRPSRLWKNWHARRSRFYSRFCGHVPSGGEGSCSRQTADSTNAEFPPLLFKLFIAELADEAEVSDIVAEHAEMVCELREGADLVVQWFPRESMAGSRS